MGTYKKTRKNHPAGVQPAKLPVVADEPAVYQIPFELQAARLLGFTTSFSNEMKLVEATRNGIKKDRLLEISHALGLDLASLCHLLHISPRTFQRLASGSNLDIYSSEQAIELALVLAKARELFTDDNAIRQWFNSPILALNGQTPASIMDTSFGARLVMKTLGKLEHGIFS